MHLEPVEMRSAEPVQVSFATTWMPSSPVRLSLLDQDAAVLGAGLSHTIEELGEARQLHPIAALEIEQEGFGVAGLGDPLALDLFILSVEVRGTYGHVLAQRHDVEERLLAIEAVGISGWESVVIVKMVRKVSYWESRIPR